MRKITLFLSLVLLGITTNGLATAAEEQEFSWQLDPKFNILINGFTICESQVSMGCDVSHNVPNSELRSYTITPQDDSKFFYLIPNTIYPGKGEKSGQVIINLVAGEEVVPEIYIEIQEENTAYIEWDPIVDTVVIQLTDTTTGEVLAYQVTGGYYYFDIPNGNNWEVDVFPVDSIGRTSTETPYAQYVIVDLPEPPDVKIETMGAGYNKVLMIAVHTDDPEVNNFIVNVYSNSELQYSGENGDLLASYSLEKDQNFCMPFDTTNYPTLFAKISSVDDGGYEGDAKPVEIMRFNPHQTYNEGFGVEDLKVDTLDYNALMAYYGKPVTWDSQNYCEDPNLFALLPFTTLQRLAPNLGSSVGTLGYNWLMTDYGKKASDY